MTYSLGKYISLLKEAGLYVRDNLAGREEIPVSGITYDSQKALPGTLFVCKGAAFKRTYLESAVQKGSICYVSETDYALPSDFPYILVSDIRSAMPVIAKLFYFGFADPPMEIFGVTGTKGKTTTCYFARSIFARYAKEQGDKGCAFLTSIETDDGIEKIESGITTPEAFELYRHLANAKKAGMKKVVLEVSSQAQKYKRTGLIPFKAAVLLNVSLDHISDIEHPSFADYLSSKLSIYSMCETALIDIDSPYGEQCVKAAAGAKRMITFGRNEGADYRAEDIRTEPGKTTFTLKTEKAKVPFVLSLAGDFNVENALAAIIFADLSGIPYAVMQRALADAAVPGRVEEFSSEDGCIKGIVDYAHNGYSFQKIIEAARTIWPDYRIVTVFGCPGGKALNRRKDMGAAAGRYSDYIYLTADDPAKEELSAICREVGMYIEEEGCPYEVIYDRETAIRTAVEMADGRTAVLVLGKGCEKTQIEKNGKVPYASDASVLRDCISVYNKGKARQGKNIHEKNIDGCSV